MLRMSISNFTQSKNTLIHLKKSSCSMMTNQRMMLTVTVFIIIASSSVSFAEDLKPDGLALKCTSSEMEITVTNSATLKSCYYENSAGGYKSCDPTTTGYKIKLSDVTSKKTTVQFGLKKNSLIMSTRKYTVDCSVLVGSIKENSVSTNVTVGSKVNTEGEAQITLDTTTFNFETSCTMTIKLPKTYEKAIIASCELSDSAKSAWEEIHNCTAGGNVFIKDIAHTSDTDKITAQLWEAAPPDAGSVSIRCTFEACLTGSCSEFNKKYDDYPNCKG